MSAVWRCPKCGFEFSVGIRVLAIKCPKGHAMDPVAKEPITKGRCA